MKRLLLLALILGLTSTAYAQVPKKVLIEEFTNSGCGPCAITDPLVEQFELDNLADITFLKYHVSWPDDQDPYYLSQKTSDQANLRIQKLYKQGGVPAFIVGGKVAPWTTYAGVPAAMQTVLDQAKATDSPFELDVSHKIEGNTIKGTVTVKAVGDVPATELRLAFAIAERYNMYHGLNGRPFHSSIVRHLLPGIGTDGIVSQAGALTIAKGETKTVDFEMPIGATWSKEQLMSVAFIQSAITSEVYQSDWTVKAKAVADESTVVVPNLGGTNVMLTNMSLETVRVKPTVLGEMPAGWNVSFDGAEGGVATLAPDESKMLTVVVTPAQGQAIGYSQVNILMSSVDETGAPLSGLSGAIVLYFGRDNKTVIVDAGSGVADLKNVYTALVNKDLPATGIIDQAGFNGNFTDWSAFDHVIMSAGLNTGLFSDDGSFDRVGSYIQGGGKFLFSSYASPGIYFDAFDQTGEELYLDLWRGLGVDPVAKYKQLSSWSAIKGVTGDPIGGGFNPSLSPAQRYRTPVKPAEGVNAQSIFYSAADTIGIRSVIGDGKFVYLGFGLDDMTTANRNNLTGRIIDWFNATASVKVSDATSTSMTNYPNPFNPSTTIEFSVTEAAPVTLVVKDMMGREVASLIDFQMHTPGTYHQPFDATNLASGTYIYELTTGSKKLTQKMTLNK